MRFEQATRDTRKLRMLVYGQPGSGKTTSALRVGKGLADADNTTMAVFDTENSVDLHADLDFVTAHPDPVKGTNDFDLSPSAYRTFLTQAEAQGFGVVVIDSISHAWAATLDRVDRINATGNKGFKAWGEVKPEVRKLIDAIIRFRGHVIVTARSKIEWSASDRGKMEKTGTAPVFEQGLEYEFDVVAQIDRRHFATIEKDRTGLWQDKAIEKPGPAFGVAMLEELRGTANRERVEEPKKKKSLTEVVQEKRAEQGKPMREMEAAIQQFREVAVEQGVADKIAHDFIEWDFVKTSLWLEERARNQDQEWCLEYVKAATDKMKPKATVPGDK